MADRDGRPAARDPLFLLEAQLASAATAARIEAAQAAGGTRPAGAGGFSSAAASACSPAQDGAITLYSEAAAAGSYGHSVYVRGRRPRRPLRTDVVLGRLRLPADRRA
jgi:hypothetical protein